MKENKLKCTDLRIGNYLKYDDEIIQVSKLCKNYVEFYDKEDLLIGDNPNEFHPIELTEEVLVKIGFKKKNDCYILSNDCIFFVYYKDSFKQELLASAKREGKYYYNTNELKNYDIKYLHQLQNAYYCLTGKELNIEL